MARGRHPTDLGGARCEQASARGANRHPAEPRRGARGANRHPAEPVRGARRANEHPAAPTRGAPRERTSGCTLTGRASAPLGTGVVYGGEIVRNASAFDSTSNAIGIFWYTNRAVFLTICAFQRQHLFGVSRLAAGVARVELSVAGEILRQEWLWHARQLSSTVDVFVVMPNHLHGIVRPGSLPLAEFVGRVKSAVTSRARVEDSIERVWQRGFYDRILRDDIELDAVRAYITDNPSRWMANL